MNRKLIIGSLILGVLILMLMGCGAQPEATQAPVSDPTSTEVATLPSTATAEPGTPAPADVLAATEPPEAEPVAVNPTATSEPVPTPTEAVAAAEVDWLTVEGRTENDLPALGNPDALVTVIDYSDFM